MTDDIKGLERRYLALPDTGSLPPSRWYVTAKDLAKREGILDDARIARALEAWLRAFWSRDPSHLARRDRAEADFARILQDIANERAEALPVDAQRRRPPPPVMPLVPSTHARIVGSMDHVAGVFRGWGGA